MVIATLVALLVPVMASASAITEYSAGLQATSHPRDIAVGPDGNLWFPDSTGAIGRITPSGTITEFSSGLNQGSDPQAIVAGPDGNLWFTDAPFGGGTPAIGRIMPSGTITEFTSGMNQDGNPASLSEPLDIIAGPDGNLWFTDRAFFGGTPAIGRITPAGQLTKFELPAASQPQAIVAGPDGNLWFTDWPTNSGVSAAVWKITPGGVMTKYPAAGGAGGITVGPDGNLWFTDPLGAIGKITPTGTVTKYSAGLLSGSQPGHIIAGPDGDVWFTDRGKRALGKITPAGAITEYLTGIGEGQHQLEIAAGPDGNLWFTMEEHAVVGRMTPSGTVTKFWAGLRSEDSSPSNLAVGPGSSGIWFADKDGAIGRVSPVGTGGVTPKPTITVHLGSLGSGSITSSPPGISCPPTCSEEVQPGTPITLTAVPAADSVISNWADSLCTPGQPCGDFEGPCEGSSACQFVVSGDVDVTAEFGQKVVEPPDGGAITSEAPQPPATAPTPPRSATSKKSLKCRKGFKKRTVKGKARCVRVKKPRRGSRQTTAAARMATSANRQACIDAAVVLPRVTQRFAAHVGQEGKQWIRLKAAYDLIPEEYSDLCRRIGRAEIQTWAHGEWRSMNIGWKWAWVMQSNKHEVDIGNETPNGHEPGWWYGKKFRAVLLNEVKDPDTGRVLAEVSKVVRIPRL
jgi:streptogramin lyase